MFRVRDYNVSILTRRCSLCQGQADVTKDFINNSSVSWWNCHTSGLLDILKWPNILNRVCLKYLTNLGTLWHLLRRWSPVESPEVVSPRENFSTIASHIPDSHSAFSQQLKPCIQRSKNSRLRQERWKDRCDTSCQILTDKRQTQLWNVYASLQASGKSLNIGQAE